MPGRVQDVGSSEGRRTLPVGGKPRTDSLAYEHFRDGTAFNAETWNVRWAPPGFGGAAPAEDTVCAWFPDVDGACSRPVSSTI